jgi:Cu+-exporting ATPase
MASETLKLSVRGMTCANCARSVENTMAGIPGVTKAKVDLTSASATVEYDTELVKPEAIANAVRDLGYETAKAA